jgi:hypothetical protein
VRPETLDRLGDLAAAVTDTLRDAAASRWRETGSTPRQRSRAEVQDIEIEGDEPGADIDGSRASGREPGRTGEAR